jgi:anti-sigma B factor antagonist
MAELKIKQRQAGNVAILDLEGEVRIGDSAAALRGAIRNLASDGTQKILLNLAGVKYIDSSGIGELIANYTTVGRGGGQLKLLSLTEKVQNLLVITKLLTVFDVYEEESEALSSFK